MSVDKYFDAQAAEDKMRAAPEVYAQSMEEAYNFFLDEANNQNADYVGAPTGGYSYKPSFWTKLGLSMQGQGSDVQRGYVRAAEFNAKMKASYQALKAQHEGYARQRKVGLKKEAMAEFEKIAKARAFAETSAMAAGRETAMAGAQYEQSKASTRASNALTNKRNAPTQGGVNSWWASPEGNATNDWLNVMTREDPQGRIFGMIQAVDKETGQLSDFRPGVITTAADVENTATYIKSQLNSFPEEGETQRAALEKMVENWRVANLEIIANAGKVAELGIDDAKRIMAAEFSGEKAPEITAKYVAKEASVGLGSGLKSGFFSEVDVQTLEDFNQQETIDYKSAAQKLDEEYAIGKYEGMETAWATKRAGLQYLVDVENYVKRRSWSKVGREALQFLMLPGNLEEGQVALADVKMPQNLIDDAVTEARKQLGLAIGRERRDKRGIIGDALDPYKKNRF